MNSLLEGAETLKFDLFNHETGALSLSVGQIGWHYKIHKLLDHHFLNQPLSLIWIDECLTLPPHLKCNG